MPVGRAELMEWALREGAKARGRTHPNPMVGCVVARGARIIAVGHHRRAGTAHAEVVALRRAGAAARGADVYVTLEPCDHIGRTGPCTEALIEAGVRRVIVGARDPHDIVNGRGIRRLRAAGIAVEVGLLGKACRHLNEAYEHAMRTGRSFVTVKLAQSLDGRVATRTGASQWITGVAARRAGHQLRNICDAIVVGRGTVAADDPSLTCRIRGGRNPARVVLDARAMTSPRAKVITLARAAAGRAAAGALSTPTYVLVGPAAPADRCRQLERAGATVVPCQLDAAGRIDLDAALTWLAQQGFLAVLVDGGPTVVGSFFDAGCVQRIEAFVAPLVIGGLQSFGAVGGLGAGALTAAHRLTDVECRRVGSDLHVRARVVARRSARGRRRVQSSQSGRR